MQKMLRVKREDFNRILEEGRIKNRQEQEVSMRKHEQFMQEIHKAKKRAQELLRWKVRRAKVRDYKEWLAGYLEKGGKPTHYYDYPMKRILDEWRVAFRDFEIVPLYGASALCIIVAKGVQCRDGEVGHNNLYFMDDFSQAGDWVPIYSDISF